MHTEQTCSGQLADPGAPQDPSGKGADACAWYFHTSFLRCVYCCNTGRTWQRASESEHPVTAEVPPSQNSPGKVKPAEASTDPDSKSI